MPRGARIRTLLPDVAGWTPLMVGRERNANGSHKRLAHEAMNGLALVMFALLSLGCGSDEPSVQADLRDASAPEDDSSADTTEPDTNAGPDTSDAPAADDGDASEVDDKPDAHDDDTDEILPTDVIDSLEPEDTVDAGELVEPADSLEPGDTDADTADVADTHDPVDTTDTFAPDDIDQVTDTVEPADTSDTQAPLCTPTTATHPVAASFYIPVCSDVSYETDPPTSGPHYPIWATYKTYLVPINPGFLVHSLKHGAIVITWRCPDGCDAELTALRGMLAQRPADPQCDPLIQHRIIVAPRPDQDTMLVASAWGASWKADCFNLSALGDFIDARYGQGLEDDCFEGVDIEKIRADNPWHCPP